MYEVTCRVKTGKENAGAGFFQVMRTEEVCDLLKRIEKDGTLELVSIVTSHLTEDDLN